jgi:hypothetical protein
MLAIGTVVNTRTNESRNQKLLTIVKNFALTCIMVGSIGLASGMIFTGDAVSGLESSLGAAVYLGTIGILANLNGAIVACMIE